MGVQGVAAVGGGANEARGGAHRVLAVTPLGHAQAQAAEGVGNRFAGDHGEQRAAKPEFAGDAQDFQGVLVVQQHLIVEVAHHHAFLQIHQDRFQSAFLLLDPRRGGGHGLEQVAAVGGQPAQHFVGGPK